MDLKLSDKILIVTGIILSLSTLVIWNSPQIMEHLISVKPHQQTQPIGLINEALNDTRRRYSGSLSWYPLGKNQTLYENDTLFSGENSTAVIQIQSGKDSLSLTMTSNTMLSLSTANGDSLVNLELGSIASSLKSGQKIQLKIGDTQTTLKANQDSKFRIVSTAKGQALISSQAGQIDVISPEGKKGLNPDTLVDIQDNAITFKEVEYKFMQPRDGQTLVLSEAEKIPFQWQNKIQKSNSLSIQVSQDSSFNPIVAEVHAESDFLAGELKSSGAYYWRLLDKDKMQNSNIQYFNFIKKDEFRHISPPDEHFIKTDKKEEDVEFKWTKPSWSKSYQIEVAKDSEFNETLHSKSLTENSVRLVIPRGRYYWRVQTQLQNESQKISTESTEFAVGVQNSFQEFLSSLSAPAVTPPPTPAPIKSTLKNSYANAKLSFDPIEVWVEKISPGDVAPPRQVKLTINKSLDNNEVQIEFADNRNFEKSQKKLTKKNSETFQLNESGIYFARANYLDAKKQLIENPQSQMQFPYRVEYYVETPQLIQPDNNLKMVSFGEAELSLYFEWKNNKYADKYVFQMSANADFSRVLTEKITTDNSHYLNENFLQERLFWRVKAIYKNSESSWSQPRVIHLK